MTGITSIFAADGRIRSNPSIQLFAKGSFRAFSLGNLSQATGMEVRMMAQSWLILELGGSQVVVGTALGLRFLPAIFLGLIAGVWVDRFGGRYMLLWTRIMLLVLAAITAILVLTETILIWHVVALSVVSSTLMIILGPARNSLVTTLVPKSSLQAANSVHSLTRSVASALGPVATGFLIASFGLGSPWLALIGLYVLAVASTWKLPTVESIETTRESALKSLRGGIRYVRTNPVINRLMILAFGVIFLGAGVPILPVYARDRFEVGGSGLGIMIATFAIGSSIGALLIAYTGGVKRKSVAIIVASIVTAISMAGFGFSTIFPLSLFFLFVGGFADPFLFTSVITLLQAECDPKMMGRVMALFIVSAQGVFAGMMFWAWLGLQIGNDWTLLISGTAFAAIAIVVVMFSPTLRKL